MGGYGVPESRVSGLVVSERRYLCDPTNDYADSLAFVLSSRQTGPEPSVSW